ncbi:MAG: YHS domain-containing protein, partial [Candidatus Omnitrophica bacterium]|nr:YHS domain-containing protein [Candidatus Omnitrophota bacterium]
MIKDPVCGMAVDKNNALKAVKDGTEYFFCSPSCRQKFLGEKGLKSFFKNRLFIVSCIPAVFIIVSFFVPYLIPFRNSFLMYLKAIWWAVALGLFLGGVIDYYIPKEY